MGSSLFFGAMLSGFGGAAMPCSLATAMPIEVALALIIVVLPLAAFVFQVAVGRWMPFDRGLVPTAAIGVGALISLFLLFTRVLANPQGIADPICWTWETDWLRVGTEGESMIRLPFSVLVDNATVLMLVVVTVCSTLIHLFSTGYMKEKGHASGHGHGASGCPLPPGEGGGERSEPPGEGGAAKAFLPGHGGHEHGHGHGHGGYEHEETWIPHPRYSRFFAYMALFSFSMLGLVVVENLFFLFIFWELVGVCSYFLIGFDIERKAAGDAAIKAFITTRIGDIGMFLGMMVCLSVVGSLSFRDLFASVATPEQAAALGLDPTLAGVWGGRTFLGFSVLSLTGVLLFFGPVGKSAQFPLHVWLPDAMEGPTPVSALIHAATMVAAGVYLVARLFPFLAQAGFYAGDFYASKPLFVVAMVGGFTALFAATIACAQMDIKKVLAYSTISQLGYMMLGIGTGAFAAGLFHLFTHAFFKACLFLGSGSVIHAMHHEQDMRNLGGLAKKMPVTFATFLVSTLALAGLPFLLSGFYSKEAVLTQAFAYARYHGFDAMRSLPFFMALCAALLTAFYMMRCVVLTFFGEGRHPEKYAHCRESPWNMTFPLVALASVAVVGGGFWFAGAGWFEERVGPAQVASFLGHRGEEHAGAGHEEAAAPEMHASGHEEGGGEVHRTPAAGSFGEGSAADVEFAEAMHESHVPTMSLSIAVALTGLLAGTGIYLTPRLARADLLGSWGGLTGYRRILEKLYFVDAAYLRTFVNPLFIVKEIAGFFDRVFIDGFVDLWAIVLVKLSSESGDADNVFVDGAVKATAGGVLALGGEARRLQTGRLQDYLALTVILFAAMLFILFVLVGGYLLM